MNTPQAEKPQYHKFSREVARIYDAPQAVMLTYLSYKVARSNNMREGKLWFYQTVTKLAEKFPYFSRSTVDNIIKRLEKAKLIEVSNFNRLSFDRTRWFHVSQEVCDMAAEDTIFFDPTVAEELGLTEAVLIVNLRHFIHKMEGKGQKPYGHTMSPKILSHHLPFSEASIKRALRDMVKGKLIEKHHPTKPIYGLIEEELNSVSSVTPDQSQYMSIETAMSFLRRPDQHQQPLGQSEDAKVIVG